MSPTENRKLAVKRAVVVVGVVVFAAAAWSGFQVWSSWNDIETVTLDLEGARDALETTTTVASADTVAPGTTVTTATTPESTTTTSPLLFINRGVVNSFLVVGSDDSTVRADVILLVMLPPDSGDAVMVSIPRDLYVMNPCRNVKTKINENLIGCENAGVTGPEQLAIAVEDFSGVPIDHFVSFTFPGFRQIIDRVGGVEVCVGPYAIRDKNEDLSPNWSPTDNWDYFQLRAGCSQVNGHQALSWVRSRKTQQMTDAGWTTMPGVNDLTRNQRQQDLLLTALDELKEIRSIPELQGLVEDVSNAFIIDDGLLFGDAIALLWDVRTISSDDIHRVTLDVRTSTTELEESVLLLNESFQDTLIGAYPPAFQFFEGWSGG